jgi:aspartyl-tRNA(Asn)/glutamyl-tRNA(Gln) amidotransferase subunit C
MSATITNDIVLKVSKLSRLPISPENIPVFTHQLESILAYFKSLDQINVEGVEPTYQVTGQKNVLREDVVEPNRMFSQSQALANAQRQYQGYFVTTATISKK